MTDNTSLTAPEAQVERIVDVPPHVLELIQRAEIDLQIATARKYPRPHPSQIRAAMIQLATLDEETAESCFYTLKRRDPQTGENKLIQGPSVRLAEIATACYQHIRAASRVIDNNGRTITGQGVCHDLQSNVMWSVEVQRRITGKNGQTFSEDMQIMTGNAAAAIAGRNAIFKVIPMLLIKPVFEEAKRVAVGTQSSLSVKRDKLFKRFAAMGVEPERVLAAIERKTIEAVGLEELTTLIGLGTAIRDSDITIEEAFPPVEREAGPVGKRRNIREELVSRHAAKLAREAEAKQPPEEAQSTTEEKPSEDKPD
jgi:hypothetical protein